MMNSSNFTRPIALCVWLFFRGCAWVMAQGVLLPVPLKMLLRDEPGGDVNDSPGQFRHGIGVAPQDFQDGDRELGNGRLHPAHD